MRMSLKERTVMTVLGAIVLASAAFLIHDLLTPTDIFPDRPYQSQN